MLVKEDMEDMRSDMKGLMWDMSLDMGQDMRLDMRQVSRSDTEVMKLDKEAMEHSCQLSSTIFSISNFVLYPVKQFHNLLYDCNWSWIKLSLFNAIENETAED